MLRKVVAAAAILLAGTGGGTAWAQTGNVTGEVVDDRTNQALRGVLIYVEGAPVFTETDDGGRFVLTLPPGDHTLVASAIGYALLRAPVTVAAAATQPLIVRLSEGAGRFTDRVTVTAAAFGGERESRVETLHGRELETLRGVMLDDPLRAVQALPSATATDDFYSEFAVRGSSFDHIGLTVDGIATRYLMHTVHGVTDGGSIAMINSETLGAVTLRPGSYPQHNGRALSAQVELTTREGSRDRFRLRTGLSGTSATVLAEGPLAGGRGSWLGSVRKSYLGYLVERIDPEATFVFGFADGQARLTYDLTPRHTVWLTTLVGRAAFEEGEPDLTINDRADALSHAWLTAVGWRYGKNDRFVVTSQIYSTGLRFDQRNRRGETLEDGAAHDVGGRADLSYEIEDGWLLGAGADAQRLSGRHARMRISGSGPQLLHEYREGGGTASAYAQLRVPLGARASVTPGGRVDHWGITDATTASPWITGELELTPSWRVRAGAGLHRQFPRLEQVYGANAGGPGLRPQRALQMDISAEYAVATATRLTATVYGRREHDVLWTPALEPRLLSAGTFRAGASDAPWVNGLAGRAKGLEIVLRRDAAGRLSGWMGYAYSRARYIDAASGDAFWADSDQRHTASLYANVRLSARSTISAKLRYGSNYPIRGYVGPPIEDTSQIDGRPVWFRLTSERNTQRLPPYARLDVRADRAFHWRGARLVVFGEVANVLNRRNLRNAPYGVDRFRRVLDPTEPLMPIVPSAGFIVEF